VQKKKTRFLTTFFRAIWDKILCTLHRKKDGFLMRISIFTKKIFYSKLIFAKKIIFMHNKGEHFFQPDYFAQNSPLEHLELASAIVKTKSITSTSFF
jgi:hypothetical protein